MLTRYEPHIALRPYVQYYTYAEVGEKDKWTMQNLATPACAAMALVTERTQVDLKVNNTLERYESLALIGQVTRFKQVSIFDKRKTFWVIFRPGGFYGLTGIDQKDHADACINLTDLMGSKILPYKEKMIEQNKPEELVKEVESFLLSKLFNKKKTEECIRLSGVLEQLKSRCHERNIIRTICEQSGYSISSFERHTRQMIGICPKQFQRIVRFNMAMQTILKQMPPVNWTQLAFRFGYSDQSHFIKEFRLFYGKTPSAMLPTDSFMKKVFF